MATNVVSGNKIPRKHLATYINISEIASPSYELIGIDLEELTVNMNPTVEKKKNILGETSANLTSYEKQTTVAPYIAVMGSGLHSRLQGIIDNEKILDDVKTDIVEVQTWGEATSGAYPAYKQEAIIAVTSYGGDTNGYQIPFELHYIGSKIKGMFNPETKEFTPD